MRQICVHFTIDSFPTASLSTRMAAGVTFCSPEKNHPWWSHPCGVHLDTRFLESVRLAGVPSYGRELYVILALLLGCNVIPLGDKVFFRRVGTRGEISMAERGVSKDSLEYPSLTVYTVRYSNQPHTLQEVSTQVYPRQMATPRMVLFRQAASNTSGHTWRD